MLPLFFGIFNDSIELAGSPVRGDFREGGISRERERERESKQAREREREREREKGI